MKVRNNSARDIFLATALLGTVLLPAATESGNEIIPSETEVSDEVLQAASDSPVIDAYFKSGDLELVDGVFVDDDDEDIVEAEAELAEAQTLLEKATTKAEKAAAEEAVKAAQNKLDGLLNGA
jgi:hypothetical protein